MKRRSITVVGSSNTDMVIRVDRIPRPGETVLGGEFVTAAGGKGANQAVAAARVGGAVTFVARVGRDSFGDRAIAGFEQDGINVMHVARDLTAPSGVALIFVARAGENSIAVASGANARLDPAQVRQASGAIAASDILLTQLETPLESVRLALAIADRAGVRTILNPAPARALPRTLLKLVSVITPNEHEAELLTGIKVDGERAATKAADKLLRQGVQTVVLTLGARGAFVATRDGHSLVPGFNVKAVDTTAAGDIFNGSLAVGLAEGMPVLEAVRFANAAAAISVTRIGAQPSAPTRREIARFVQSQGLGCP